MSDKLVWYSNLKNLTLKAIVIKICLNMFAKATCQYDMVVTMEENVYTGGFGQQVQSYLCDIGFKGKVLKIAVPDEFVQHGSVTLLFKELRMDAQSITERILESLGI